MKTISLSVMLAWNSGEISSTKKVVAIGQLNKTSKKLPTLPHDLLLGPDAWSYWFKHAGRSGYFAGNAVLGTLGSSLHERSVKNSNDDSSSNSGGLPFNINSSVATVLLLNAFLCYEQDPKCHDTNISICQ